MKLLKAFLKRSRLEFKRGSVKRMTDGLWDQPRRSEFRMNTNVTFQARCSICNNVVTAMPLLARDEIQAELKKQNGDVRVMHRAQEGDHIWSLTSEDRVRLSNTMAKGLI
jgi:hypothetical protein